VASRFVIASNALGKNLPVRWATALALCIFGLLGSQNVALAAIAYVQSNQASPDNSSLSSLSATFSSAQTAGNFNVVAVGWGTTAAIGITSVTDSKGNSYTPAVGPTFVSGTGNAAIYYAKNIAAAAAGANTVTVTFNSAVGFPDIRMAEYSGISTTSPLDVTAVASGTSTLANSGSATTTNANDLLIGSNWYTTGITSAGTGYTQRQISGWDGDILEDQTVSTAGPHSATAVISTSSPWIMQMAAFKAAGSGGDTSPPSAPTGLASPASSDSQINLTWAASTDNVGVTGYLVERCLTASCTFAQIGTSTTTTYLDTSVSAATSYNYRVRAKDASSNLSGYSSTVTASTAAAVSYPCTSTGPATVCYFYDELGRLKVVQHDDGGRQTYILDAAGNRLSNTGTPATPPTQPAVLTVLPHSATSMSLSWNAPRGGNGQYTYVVYRGGQALPSVTTTSMTDTGLSPHTTYSYTVSAVDSAGNQSGQTAPVSNTTYANPVISTFSAASTSATSITLTWAASNTGGPSGGLTYTVTRGSATSCTTSPCTDTGLSASTPYTYTLTATDTAGDTVTASTTGQTYALPVISSFTATPASTTSLTLTWIASDSNGPPGSLTYSVTRGSTTVPGCTASPCTDTGLSGGVSYTYTLTARDSTGVDQATATTSGDPTPGVPSVPLNLNYSPSGIVFGGQYLVGWSPSTVTGSTVSYYNLLEVGVPSGPTITYTVTGPLTSMSFNKGGGSREFTYQVRACTPQNSCSDYSTPPIDVVTCPKAGCP
jgi:chitodextrinase